MITQALIQKCAELSRLAYDANPDIYGEQYDTQLTITKWGKFLIVAFRGTSSKKDIIQDLKRRQEYGIHLGVFQCVEEIRGELIMVLDNHLDHDPKLQVVVTGHSLGGAEAQVMTTELKHKLDLMSHCITFGSPRVGDKKFCKDLIKSTCGHLVIVENTFDAVTWVPFFGYTKPKSFLKKICSWKSGSEHPISDYEKLVCN